MGSYMLPGIKPQTQARAAIIGNGKASAFYSRIYDEITLDVGTDITHREPGLPEDHENEAEVSEIRVSGDKSQRMWAASFKAGNRK